LRLWIPDQVRDDEEGEVAASTNSSHYFLDITNHIGYQSSRPSNPKRKGKKGGNPDRGVRAKVWAAGAESSGSKPKLR
jgi:hypothetical protein